MLVQTFPEAYPATCTMGIMSFFGVKQPGRGANFSPPSRAELANSLELYFRFPSVLAYACHG